MPNASPAAPTAAPATAPGEPFADPVEAWFWCVQCALARVDGARLRAGLGGVPRPCEPLDIIASIDRLYRQRRLLSEHLEVLVDYGRRLEVPDPAWREEASAARLWDEAFDRIGPVLRRKGIVA